MCQNGSNAQRHGFLEEHRGGCGGDFYTGCIFNLLKLFWFHSPPADVQVPIGCRRSNCNGDGKASEDHKRIWKTKQVEEFDVACVGWGARIINDSSDRVRATEVCSRVIKWLNWLLLVEPLTLVVDGGIWPVLKEVDRKFGISLLHWITWYLKHMIWRVRLVSC